MSKLTVPVRRYVDPGTFVPFQEHKNKPKDNGYPVLTIPGQSLTIDEIMQRFASGRSIDVKQYTEYTGDDDRLSGVDVRTLDIVDVVAIQETLKADLEKVEQERRRREKVASDAKLEAAMFEKFKLRKTPENIADDYNPVLQTPQVAAKVTNNP